MSNSFKGITIHEGYNDIGTFDVNITEIEQPSRITAYSPESPKGSRKLLFRFLLATGEPVTQAYRGDFTVLGQDPSENSEYVAYPNAEGYVEIDTPEFPVVVIPEDLGDNALLRLDLTGPLEERSEECYMEVLDAMSASVYTLIRDIFIDPVSGKLAVQSESDVFYLLATDIEITAGIKAVHITAKGVVFGFDESLGEWNVLGTLEFTMIEFPENLDAVEDGFYKTTGATGTLTAFEAGDTGYEDYSVVLLNPGIYLVNVEVEVSVEPDGEVFSGTFTNLMPGSLDFTVVTVTGTAPVKPDTSPTVEEIATLAGITFTEEFLTFLEERELATIDNIRKAGPISYISGFNSDDISPEDLNKLQGHVSLYDLNKNAVQNQRMISTGFTNVLAIAYCKRKAFLDAVVNVDLPLFQAAKVHELAVQNQKLTDNLMAGVLGDLRLASPSTPEVEGSEFVERVLGRALNTCGCDDCKSAISPFAYLFDLIRYGAMNMEHVASPVYLPGSSLSSYVNLLANNFLQPFNRLRIDCKTLHEEFCRVRLVTEVLVKKVEATSLPSPKSEILQTEINQFLQLVYQAILLQAGSSFNEVRSVYLTQAPNKLAAAQKLSDRLGIPLYVPYTTDYTVDVLWLTLNNPASNHELSAVNLEEIFGFRDIQRDPITDTPTSYVETWHAAYLRDFWRTQDYVFTNYSREGAVPDDPGTFKNNWMPIIDPDIIGWEDMTYLTATDSPVAKAAKALWKNRKRQTDEFLKSCVLNNILGPLLSADIKSRILKVANEDIVTHVIEDNTIYIKKFISPTWDPFEIYSRTLNGTDTDVILVQSTMELFNPYGNTMRYNRIIPVPFAYFPVPPEPVNQPFPLTWPLSEPVFANATGAYAKLTSAAYPLVSYTSPTDFTFTLNADNEVEIEFLTSAPDSVWLSGGVSLTYEVSYGLFFIRMVDPVYLIPYMFNAGGQSYIPLAPAVITDPYDYTVFETPAGWTGTYDELKELYAAVSAGTATEAQLLIVSEELHLTIPSFNRLMVLMGISERYLAAIFTAPAPTISEQYEIASILYTAAKTQLQRAWVQEEINYVEGVDQVRLMLSGQYFWKALNEPAFGAYDPSLQTIPETFAGVEQTLHTPIINPLYLPETSLCLNPEAKPYRDLYTARKGILDAAYDLMLGLVSPHRYEGFEELLNYVNTGDEDDPYNVAPYASLADLISDLTGMDPFNQKEAADVAYSAFGINASDFLEVYKIKIAYEDPDASNVPVLSILSKAVRLLLPGYARVRLYFISGGWIEEEIEGTFTGGGGVMVEYFNVRKLRLAPGRGNVDNRKEWQRTLAAWNRQPFIQPDLVPPENIKDFIPSNDVYDTWNLRHTELIDQYNDIATVFNSGSDAEDLFTELQIRINIIVSRSAIYFVETPPDTYTYLPYFLEIETIEEKGEDIRPNLEVLGIKPNEYRFLLNIYKLLETEADLAPTSPSSMVESEYDDVINILIAIRSRNLPFEQVLEEYAQDILLDQDYFLNYKPALVSFPLADLPVYNPWRSPYKEMKAWKDILESRIEMEQGVVDRWKEVLKETEDKNMPLLRDALIRALTADCQAWQDKAEELAKTYFIETKDNCCVKHTRVSFAIETMQGFINALQTGIYDGFVANFRLYAPFFVKEWAWLGSYATWRAAMFVYIYPENLLYPTLKKRQSPAFIKLAETVQNANRFSPNNACDAAHDFQVYLEDIKDLDIICTVNSWAKEAIGDPNDCCVTELSALNHFVYYFAKGKSGAAYWSKKIAADNSKDGHGFWEELPIPKDVRLIGCFAYSKKETPAPLVPGNVSLLLFYSYNENGKLKISYIKKDIYDVNSAWTDETETDDLPSITANDHISQVTACQTMLHTDFPAFILSYTVTGQTYNAQSIRHYNPEEDKWIESISAILDANLNANTIIYSIQSDDPKLVAGIRFDLITPGFPSIDAYAYVFEKEIIVQGYARRVRTNRELLPGYYKILSAFQSANEPSALIVFHQNSSGNILIDRVKIKTTGMGGPFSCNQYIRCDRYPLTLNGVYNITKSYPVFSLNGMTRHLAFNTTSGNLLLGADITNPPAFGYVYITNHFALAPERLVNTPVQSAECINDMDLRALNIKTEIRANTNAPEGTSVGAILRTSAVKELLYEAYYFAPMLLALDQQKRGEFPAALNWYRSVYDFTRPEGTPRKIFYGLVLEETIANVYTHTPNWLLDPLNPHLIAQSRTNAYSQYTIVNIVQCLFSYADREFTLDTIETVPVARRLYTEALELLKVRELNPKGNLCEQAADACLDTKVELSADPVWKNLFERLKQKLIKLGNAATIQSLEADIVDLLNSGDEETYAEKFSEAFEMIDDGSGMSIMAAAAGSPIVTQMELSFANAVNAYDYLYALNDHSNFNEQVANNFTALVAEISGMDPSELEDPGDRINWLNEAIPANLEVDYTFEFANESGVQRLGGEDGYNPLSPTRKAYDANVAYTNANFTYYRSERPPREHMPFFDFSFCMPKNPVYQSLQLKGNVELYKIHNCRNIAGMVRELDPYAAATDSTTGMPFIGASGNLVMPGIGNYAPVQYRFRTLIERAKQMVAQAQQMESLFLAALEKLDNESYSQLRARQDLQTAKATVKLQNLRITQANHEQDSALIQLDKATFTQEHFNDLISAGVNAFEIVSLALLQTSVIFSGLAAAQYFVAATVKYDDALSLVGQAQSSVASALSTQSSVFSQMASFQRRQEEWGFQKDLAGFDIKLANQQIKIAEDNVRIVTQERDIAQMNTDHATDNLEFLKTKFTNAELYNYMSNVLERSYSYMLNLATSTARVAERQLYFERQEQAGPFVLDDYWESPSNGSSGGSTDRRGLTGSARLAVDITRLDQYAFETNKRKLQMTKVISLAQNFPSEFQQFKETGVINFALTNKLFDYDFPGHYLRLINSVKTTVVGLLPVYDSIKATLTSAATSYTVIGGTIFQRVPLRRMSIDSVALTSANNATGVFEMQPMQSELMNPFENMGIESQWEFKMPRFSNRMDYTNIADVLLTVEYTAMDSFLYRTQVLQELDYSLSFNRGFSFKNNFPDQWYELGDMQPAEADALFSVSIDLKRELFPQGVLDLKLNAASGVLLYFVRADGYTEEIDVADFALDNGSAGTGGLTVNGILRASNTVNSNPTPVMKLKLTFENGPVTRALFSEGKVTDILVLVSCKAELPAYPL